MKRNQKLFLQSANSARFCLGEDWFCITGIVHNPEDCKKIEHVTRDLASSVPLSSLLTVGDIMPFMENTQARRLNVSRYLLTTITSLTRGGGPPQDMSRGVYAEDNSGEDWSMTSMKEMPGFRSEIIAEIKRLHQKAVRLEKDNGFLEKQLNKHKYDQRILFDSIPTGIWFIDNKGQVIFVNRAGASFLSMPKKDIMGRYIDELFPPERTSTFMADLIRIINFGKPIMGTVEQYVLPSGEKQWMRIDKVPHYEDNGDVIGMIMIMHDIADKRDLRTSFARRKRS